MQTTPTAVPQNAGMNPGHARPHPRSAAPVSPRRWLGLALVGAGMLIGLGDVARHAGAS